MANTPSYTPIADGMIAELGRMDLDGENTTHHPEGPTSTTPKAPEVRTPNTSETSNPTVVAPRANIPGRGHGQGRRGKANRVPNEKSVTPIPIPTYAPPIIPRPLEGGKSIVVCRSCQGAWIHITDLDLTTLCVRAKLREQKKYDLSMVCDQCEGILSSYRKQENPKEHHGLHIASDGSWWAYREHNTQKEKDFLSIPNATPTGPKFWEFLESILKTHGESRHFVSQRNFSPNCFTFTYPENGDSE
jgi:hypothetical protein